MPNPALTDAQFAQVFDRWLEPLCWWLTLRESWRRFSESSQRMREVDGNGNGFATAWDLSIDVKALTQGGNLYVRVTDENPGAGQSLWSIYRATGAAAGNLIMQGSGADSGDITLTAQNSSNCSGVVTVGVVNASVANDLHYLVARPDFPLRVLDIFDGAEAADFGPERLASRARETLQAISDRLLDAMDDCVTLAEDILREYVSDRIQSSDIQGIFRVLATLDTSSGSVTIQRTGLVEALRLVMAENTNTQAIPQKVPTFGGFTASANNRGKLTYGTMTLGPNARPGTLTVKCTTGGSTNFGAEQCTVTLKPTDNGGKSMDDRTLTAQAKLMPFGTWRAEDLGIESVAISRDVDKTGDAANINFAAADITVTGEDGTNTNAGILYGVVTGASPNLVVSFYDATGAAAGDLVAQVSGIANGAAYTATQQNSSGLTVTGTAGSGPDASEVTFDLNGLESDSNSGNVPDEWYGTISDPASLAEGIQDTVGEIWGPGVELRETAGAPEIYNGALTRGGPDPDLVVV